MILTITLNVALDKYYKVPSLVNGEVNRVEKVIPTAGGKGLNVARVVNELESTVTATGIVGGHTGNLICEMLDAEGLTYDFFKVPLESRTCINIVDSSRNSTEILEAGERIDPDLVTEFLNKVTDLICLADIVTLSGSAMKGMPEDIYYHLISIVKEQNKQVILDTSGNLFAKGILAAPTLIKPNRQEIEQMIQIKNASIEEIISFCEEYITLGVKKVVVSLGAEGALLITGNGVWKGEPPKINTVNTVGSGDSMVGALAVGLSKDYTDEILLRYSIAVSAANTLTESTGQINREDVSKLYEKVTITKLS
ncbi:1-phosphofructokinase [Sporosarcina obsidiansis]|uniref:1-phosphofructokinase n=1 Tax=Sporosarcina obsidiansis TaxID=2660748 RepID=UPI00129A44C0|nr:1-phosphofructokinase [Sporosarcina obsidiansis]